MNVVYFGFDSSKRRDYRVTCGPDDLPPIPLGNLMEAAPEMLEALRKAQAWLDPGCDATIRCFINAAITKATQEGPNATRS
jgi:hypothetical protein